MNNLGFIEKLLDGVGVEWKFLGDVAEYSQTRVHASVLNTSSFVGVDNLIADKGGRVDATYMPNTARLTAYEAGDILLGNIRPYLKKVWKATNSGGCSGDVLAVRLSDNFKKIVTSDYLYYLLSSDEFFSYNMQHAKGAKMPRGNKAAIMNYKIPIPCPDNPKKSLEIQAEIVRILDAFTAMTTELTAELNLRQQQYNYYRDQLLSFEEGEVEWKTLGDVCVIGDGNHSSKYPRSDEMVEKGVPFIRGTNMVNGTISSLDMKFITPEKHQELKKGHLKAYDVLMANRGEIGKIAQVPKNFSGANLNSQLAWLRAKQDLLLPRFLFYVLNTSHVQSTISGEGGALQQLTIKNIKLIRIPVPTIEKQSGIVAILDKFDALTSSITEGLPCEIELRQKQYEYYRDLLLSFPKPEAG